MDVKSIQPTPPNKNPYRWIKLICFTAIIGGMVALKFLLPDWVNLLEGEFSPGICFVIEAMVPYLLVFVLLWIFSGWLFLSSFRFSWGVLKFRPSYILLGVLFVFAAQMVVAPLYWLLPEVEWFRNTDQVLLAMQSGFFPMLVMIVLYPLLNQIIFRGIFFSVLRRNFGLWWAALFASLLCGWSFVVPQMMVTGFASSFVYCAMYALSGSMVSIIMIHVIVSGVGYLGFLILGSEAFVRDLISERVTWSVGLWTLSVVALIVLGWQFSGVRFAQGVVRGRKRSASR